MRRAVRVSRCLVGALALAFACSRIDDEDCLATRTCPRSSAGQGGDSGGARDAAPGGGGAESGASGGCDACDERAR